MWIFRSIKELWRKGISKGSIFINKTHDIIKVTTTKIIKWAASNKRLDHSSSPTSKHVLYKFRARLVGTERTFWAKVKKHSLHAYSPSFFGAKFRNSKGKHNSSVLACFPRDSSSINRRGHWRSNARVWNTKQLSLSKQKLSNLFTSLSTIIFISLRIFVSIQG